MFLDEPALVVNMAKCLECGDVIQSRHVHDFVSCSCYCLSVDGGQSYLKRSWNDHTVYKEMSLYSDSTFEEIRKHLCRGSRGKDGTQPFTWIPLKDIDDEYLSNLIKYKEDNNQTTDVNYLMYLKERDYRAERT